jgi:hypothetical protein
MNIVFGSIAFVILNALACAAFRDIGYRRGRKDGDQVGYERGRVDADNWWLDVEQQIDQARQRIWREEGMKS